MLRFAGTLQSLLLRRRRIIWLQIRSGVRKRAALAAILSLRESWYRMIEWRLLESLHIKAD